MQIFKARERICYRLIIYFSSNNYFHCLMNNILNNGGLTFIKYSHRNLSVRSLFSSLQHNILRSFCYVLVLWNLFTISFLFVTSSLQSSTVVWEGGRSSFFCKEKKFFWRIKIHFQWVGHWLFLLSPRSFHCFHTNYKKNAEYYVGDY